MNNMNIGEGTIVFNADVLGYLVKINNASIPEDHY